MGLFGLGLAWRQAARAGAGDPAAALGDAILGAVTLLWLFALAAWAAKPLRRPAVVVEEMRTLPGRAGMAAMTLSALLCAAALAPQAPGLARGLLAAGLAGHAMVAVLAVRALLAAPPEGHTVTPVMHLTFVGFVLSVAPAVALGWPALGVAVFWATLAAAVAIWGASAVQFARAGVPAPLRPLLAVHLAPASVLGQAALALGMPAAAAALAAVSAVLVLVLLAAAITGWLTAAGFTPLWGAFTFPLAAAAGLMLGLGGPWAWAGAGLLAAATALIPWIAFRILRLWADGSLAARTNAAVA
jgi:tellurite resistance protein